MIKRVYDYISLVKFSHTIFAMPFAMIGFFYAITTVEVDFTLRLFILMLLCMVFARNAAMSFNRLVDRRFDVLNPRTAKREIPAGIISIKAAVTFITLNSFAFVVTAYFINDLCFYLSPAALVIIFIYSLSKRFTALCHLVLGLALAIAPVGAYIAVAGSFSTVTLMIGLIVIFWSSGFDILYALQDRDFDNQNNLHSIPARFGIKGALIISAVLHLLAISTVFVVGAVADMSYLYYIGAVIFSVILLWEHIVVTPNNLSRVNLAFATMNGSASLIFAFFTVISFYFD